MIDDDDDGMDEVEVPWVDGVLESALGALGDEHWGGCDRVLVLSCVKSMRSGLGGMILILGFFEGMEMVDDSRLVVQRMTRFWVWGRRIYVSECDFPSH